MHTVEGQKYTIACPVNLWASTYGTTRGNCRTKRSSNKSQQCRYNTSQVKPSQAAPRYQSRENQHPQMPSVCPRTVTQSSTTQVKRLLKQHDRDLSRQSTQRTQKRKARNQKRAHASQGTTTEDDYNTILYGKKIKQRITKKRKKKETSSERQQKNRRDRRRPRFFQKTQKHNKRSTSSFFSSGAVQQTPSQNSSHVWQNTLLLPRGRAAFSFRPWLVLVWGGNLFVHHRGDILNISEGLHLVSRRRCPGVVLVVHLRSVVVRLRVGVETQLVVITCVHPQKVGVIAVPVM